MLLHRRADGYITLMVYATCMKRLQILIDEELDAALDRQARAEGRSKAALIRQYVADAAAALRGA